MDVALWGYKEFGQRTSESLLKYWEGKYRVTGIYDPVRSGGLDPYWNITVQDPGQLKADFDRGLFEKIIVCEFDKPIRDDIIAELNAMGISELFPGDPADFVTPEEFGAEVTDAPFGAKIYRSREAFAARADHLSWECNYVFNSQGRILAVPWFVNDWFDPELPLIYPFPLKNPMPERVRMPGSYCLLTKIFGNNYWHFTFQNLCDVLILEKSGFTGVYIISNAKQNRELMLMMGIAPERILSIDSLAFHTVYIFEELYGVQLDHRDHMLESTVVAECSRLIRKNLKRIPSYPKYIYVKRIGMRKLTNGDELAAKYGFATIIPEELSVKEQMEYFFNADIVLCPHGANSTNCLYMHENSVFIEVFSDRWYLDLNSEVCGINHVHHLKVVGKASGTAKIGIHDDYAIPENRIRPFIRRAFDILPGHPEWPTEMVRNIQEEGLEAVCGRAAGILIYGAWVLGARAYEMIGSLFKDKLLGFAVTSMEGNPEEINGYPVHTVEEWKSKCGERQIDPEQVAVFMALNPLYYDEIYERLKKTGVQDIFMLEDLEWHYNLKRSEKEWGNSRNGAMYKPG